MEILEQFTQLIKNGEYYEAHEVLEEYWHTIRKTSHPYKNVYRGFINAAVALELKKRGRNNCEKVWKNFEKYRDLYLKEEKFIKVMKFLDSFKCH